MAKILATMLADKEAIATLLEETLSDGSKAYNLTLGNVTLACFSEADANRAFDGIHEALQPATVEKITTF